MIRIISNHWFHRLHLASLEPPRLHPRPWLGTTLMATQFTVMPPTLPDQLWSLAGQQRLRRQPTLPTSPTTAALTLLAPATWTKPTATPSLMELMAMSWFQATTMSLTIMLALSWPQCVGSLHETSANKSLQTLAVYWKMRLELRTKCVWLKEYFWCW